MVSGSARLTALHGAEILFYPTAIGWHPGEKKEYGALQHICVGDDSARSCDCEWLLCRVANRIGHEAPAGGEGIEFWGQSFVCDPYGQMIVKGRIDEEEIVVAEIDSTRVNEHRTHWPFLRDAELTPTRISNKRFVD